MTPKKKSHLKKGPKPDSTHKAQNKILREQYLKDGVTPWQAALIAKCSYPYACQKFREFGAELVDAQEDDWLERNEQARKRALEGLSLDIIITEGRITKANKALENDREIHNSIMGNIILDVEETEAYNDLQNLIGTLDQKKVLQLFQITNKGLDMQKNYGYYLIHQQKLVHELEVYKTELKAQYDTIEIIPSPLAVWELEMEKRIAERNAIKENKPQK